MLTLYRRHSLDCPKQKDRYWKRCACPMWVEGTLGRKYMRESLRTRSWERGKDMIDAWDEAGHTPVKTEVPTIKKASTDYVADCRDNGFADLTLTQHGNWTERFTAWCERNNYRTVAELDTEAVSTWFRQFPKMASSTRFTYRIRLSAFFNFCIRRKWITEDPVKGLGKLIVRLRPTEYLTPDELKQLLTHIKEADTFALTLLMRWSGLRITDAMKLERGRIDRDGMLFLYTHKTGFPVRTPLPPVVMKALENLRVVGRHFLIYDKQDPYNMGAKHRMRMAKAADKAGIVKHVHPHMLRDTFAIELLLAGVPIDQVSILLGHKSVKTTEKHYAPFVKARQDQLNNSVRQSWH